MTETKQRSSFSGRIGFVLAAAGSAVGLGNLWRFPYLAAKYGGGIFLLVYIILAITFGFGLMVAEIAIGRKTGLSAVGAYKKLNKKFSFLGWLTSIVPMIILPYYCVIGGWVAKYLSVYVSGQGQAAAEDSFFSGFISGTWPPIFWFFLFVAVTAVIVLFGVEKGVERASKIMMPILVVLSLVIAMYSVTRPGALEGVKYYLLPNFSDLTPGTLANTLLGAVGQLFYSMSLAMGIMITYGSYMKKENDLEKAVGQIEIFDTGIALLAGLMIIPAVFAFTGAAPEKPGPGLMFQALPKVFNSMSFGAVFGAIFFLLVLFAALTSAISLMETVVSIFQDKFGWKRRPTCALVAAGCLVLGCVSCLGYSVWDQVTVIGMQFLDFFDFISNSVIMPIVALLTCICIGYVVGTKTVSEEVKLSSRFRREKLFVVVIKYFAPICLVLILISSVLSAFGVMKI